MNVGLVVPGFSAEPTDWCIPALRDFAHTLAVSDSVRVIAVRYPYRGDRYRIDGADVIALGGADRHGVTSVSLWRHALRAIAREHRRIPFDVLHAFWATESGLLAALAGRLLRVPVLVSLAGGELVGLRDIGYGDQLRRLERLKIAAALRLATAVSAGSRYLISLARRRVTRPVEWLPLGVDTQLFTPRTPRDDLRVLQVGGLTPVKDQRTLMSAFAQVRQQVPTARLEIVGGGPLLGELQALATSLGVADSVCFRSAMDHGLLPAAYQAASVFVLSSRHEAQGMVALEAAASGIPVVGTAVGVVPELAPDGCVAPRDAAALAGGIEAVLRTRGEISQHAAMRPLVETTFSLEVCVERFRQCYARLAA